MRALGLVVVLAGTAWARPAPPIAIGHAPAPGQVRTLTGQTLFLNKCEGGCMVKPGVDNASTDTSELTATAALLPEFAWQAGEWEAIVRCVKEVYSPYNVVVTDTRPAGEVYNEVIVAGGASDLGEFSSCGVAFVNNDCSPRTNAVSFAFVDGAVAGDSGCYRGYTMEEDGNSVFAMCWIIAQESAHTYGLDHAFGTFDSGQSTCNDPMTYSGACGGQKFFRNDFAACNGNDGKKKPGCGPADTCATRQNAHLKLLDVLGPGTPITAKPVAMVTAPAAGTTVAAGASVVATASAQRGVARVELWINGYKWGDMKGVAFGPDGQPAASYAVAIPSRVPDSTLDIVMKAFDDIDIEGDSQTVTVTKGKAGGCDPSVANPDGTIDTCLKGMQCTAGRCAWTDAGQGAFGDACTYDEFCTTNLACGGTATETICTHDCDPAITDPCPMGYVCTVGAGATSGVCFLPQAAGCCSADAGPVGPACLAVVTFAALGGRRRRRRRIE